MNTTASPMEAVCILSNVCIFISSSPFLWPDHLNYDTGSTHNKVSVPTSRRRGGCSILISGDVTLSLDYVGGSKEWRYGDFTL